MGKAFWESSIGRRLGKGSKLRMPSLNPEQSLILSVYVDDIKLAGKKQNIDPMWKVLMKDVDLGEPTSLRKLFLMVLWYGRSCEEICGKILRIGEQNHSTLIQSLNSMPWWLSLPEGRTGIGWSSVKSLLSDCLKMLVLGHIGRLGILRSMNKLTRAVSTCEAQQCRLGLFQDSDFAGDPEDSTSTSWGLLCFFGSHTFVPVSWMCKKTDFSFTQFNGSWKNFLDAGLCMDGIPALDLWDLVIEGFHSSPNQLNNTKDQVRGNLSRDTPSNKHTHNQTKVPIQHDTLELCNGDHVSSNAKSSHFGAMLYISEDNEAVIKMFIKGKVRTMRHVSRTRRVALDWLFDRINLDPKIQIKNVDTKHQLADILTKKIHTWWAE